MQEVPVDKLVEGQDYYIQNKYIARDKQIGTFITSKYGAPVFEIRNIIKKNGEPLYNGQQGKFGRSTSLSAFFKPRKEEIINASLQRQALQQTLSSLVKDKEMPEDIESHTGKFLDGKSLKKKKGGSKKKKGGFKKYKTLSTRYTQKRKNNKTNKKSTV